MADELPAACPMCGHPRHNLPCTVEMPWWRRWFLGQDVCGCSYWERDWSG